MVGGSSQVGVRCVWRVGGRVAGREGTGWCKPQVSLVMVESHFHLHFRLHFRLHLYHWMSSDECGHTVFHFLLRGHLHVIFFSIPPSASHDVLPGSKIKVIGLNLQSWRLAAIWVISEESPCTNRLVQSTWFSINLFQSSLLTPLDGVVVASLSLPRMVVWGWENRSPSSSMDAWVGLRISYDGVSRWSAGLGLDCSNAENNKQKIVN